VQESLEAFYFLEMLENFSSLYLVVLELKMIGTVFKGAELQTHRIYISIFNLHRDGEIEIYQNERARREMRR